MQRLHLSVYPLLVLMTERSVLSRGVGHKLNVVIRFFVKTRIIMESVGMLERIVLQFLFYLLLH